MGGCGSRNAPVESTAATTAAVAMERLPKSKAKAPASPAPDVADNGAGAGAVAARIDGLSAYDPMETSVGADEETERSPFDDDADDYEVPLEALSERRERAGVEARAMFKVGDTVVYMQREGSAALPATVESVNFPGRDEGPAAQVTYTVDISGRKRETTQDRLSHVTDTMPWHPNSGTLALEPPPRPSGSSRVPYDAATAAPAAVSTVALVQPGRVPFSPHAPTPPPPAQHSSQHSRHGSAADSPLRQSGGTDTPPRRAPPQYLRMVPGEPFVPTYEWQEVGGRMIPPGLDIKTFMDDSCPTIAKIPSEWRLVVDVNEDFFHRTNVLRGTLIADIKKEILAERFKGRNMKLVLLADKRELPDDSASVADAALFGKKIACIATALA